MGKDSITSLGAVVTAFLASLCCIGPAVLAAAGVGGLGFLSIFNAYRPYLIGLSLALLGLTFFRVYRKREVLCEDGSCKMQSAGRWSKTMVWIAFALISVLIAYPNFGSGFSQEGEKEPLSGLQMVSIPVSGMTCEGCNKHVESVVEKVDGVKRVTADFTKNSVDVTFDVVQTSADAIVAKINTETGYKAFLPDSMGAE